MSYSERIRSGLGAGRAGTPDQPYVFEKSVAVWLDAPLLEGAEFNSPLDDGEPTAASPRFATPINLADTTTLRTVPFRNSRKVSPYGLRSLRQIGRDSGGLPVAAAMFWISETGLTRDSC